MSKKSEFCIMRPDVRWSTTRFPNSHRHEIFGGANRHKSIEDGLVIFLRPEDHILAITEYIRTANLICTPRGKRS